MQLKKSPLFQISIALLVLGITSCAGMASQTEKSAENAATSATDATTDATPQVTEIVEDVPAVTANNCLECHTDKERLIDNAKPVLEVISENEGAG